jgi:hypothetical protein
MKLLMIFHPRRAVLQSFVDGELGRSRSLRVFRHLQVCPVCSMDLEQLKVDFARFDAYDRRIQREQANSLQVGLARLQGRMQFLPLSRQPVSSFLTQYHKDPMRLRCHVLSELEVYLGSHAAEALVEKLNDFETGVSQVAMEAESLLAAFLGRRAANSVIERIFQVVQAGSWTDPGVPLVQSLI